jgi:hypothetical protein
MRSSTSESTGTSTAASYAKIALVESPVQLPVYEDAARELGELVTKVGLFGMKTNLLAEPPVAVEKHAGLLLVGSALRREEWTKDVEVSETLFERLAAEPDIAPPEGRVEAEQRRVDGARAKRVSCTHCGVRPGLGPCPRCMGTGVVAGAGNNPEFKECPNCDRGFIECSVCGGTRRVVVAPMRHVNDQVIAIHELVLPALHERVEEAARGLFATAGGPIASHEHDPEPAFAQAAYRGAQAASAGEFHGFAFGDASTRAVERRARFAYGEGMFNATVKCYAQPFLVARWKVGAGRAAVIVLGGARVYAASVVEAPAS